MVTAMRSGSALGRRGLLATAGVLAGCGRRPDNVGGDLPLASVRTDASGGGGSGMGALRQVQLTVPTVT